MSAAVINGNGSTNGKIAATANVNGSSPASTKSINSLTNNTATAQNGSAQHTNGNGHINSTPKHWSQKKHESCISSQSIEKSSFLSKLRGGSDSGQFIYLDASLMTTNSSLPMDTSMGNHQLLDNNMVIQMLSGKLQPGEIVLEIQGKKVSGFTLYDVISWLKQLTKSYQSITLRTVKSSSYTSLSNSPNNINISTSSGSSCESTQESDNKLLLPYELRQYLDERFQKGSVDYDLQQIIRENVYMRTVPCTTRLPRQGEIHGQDYIFLTNDEFLEMEQNGDLLEYGVYNGHYYGTPKPPKEPKFNSNNAINTNGSTNGTDGQTTKYQQQSLSEMTSMLNLKSPNANDDNESNEINGNTEISNTTAHQLFNKNSAEDSELIPYGWEKVEDPEYGTFYIDHINKQTTYENPFLQQQLLSSSMKTFKPSASSASNLNTNTSGTPNNTNNNNQQQAFGSNNLVEDQEKENNSSQMQLTFNSTSNRRNMFFTQNPNELKGDFFKTSLLKTSHGFGFTIIGANETSEDFLQIKFVVPDGAADRDGCLRQGDVLVYVNNECVLGYTHQDVVEIFQSIPVGNSVELTVCRGYPLSIDPNDPNIEMVPLAAINNPNQSRVTPAPLASGDELTASSMNNSHMQNQLHQQISKNQEQPEDNDYYCEEYEEMYAAIVKGPKGFGFTIADDAHMNHQKVKQILDRDRCINLIENDILLEINGIQLRGFAHNQVVDVLKDCVKGKETIIKLKRKKFSIMVPSKSSTSNLNGTCLSNGNGIGINNCSPKEHKANGVSNQLQHSPTEQNNSSQQKQNSQINTQQQQYNSMSRSTNPNQVAFNYERRSKTPNILQSNNSSFLNGNYNGNQSSNGYSTSTTGQYQPQLRSKTPTTDRVLFQNSMPNGDTQFETSNNNTMTNNDYIYLTNSTANAMNNANTNGMANGTSKKPQSQHNKLDTLYSTVNKSTRTPVNASHDECDNIFVEKKTDNIENIAPNSSTNIKEHMPIYDSTTNIQHQRVIQNLNRFNHHQQQQQQLAQQQQQLQQQQGQFHHPSQQQQYDLRSKTPGPDICYFRENNGKPTANTSQYLNNSNINGYNGNNKTMLNGSQMNLRSKTPTAEMMYYPTQNGNANNGLLKRGQTSHAISSTNFENIYHPFGTSGMVQPLDANQYNEYNVEEMNMINANGGLGSRPMVETTNQITSDVDGNSYVEMTIDLYRQESGFGFRIVGGEEEGSQVAVGFIVQGGAAHVDGRLRPSDEIIMIDNECVLGSTHRKVVQLMTIAGLNRKVKLMIRRKIASGDIPPMMPSVSSTNSSHQRFVPQNNSGRNSRQLTINPTCHQPYPYTITLFRNGNEGFGFVIISTANKSGPSIGKIVENSPADRCQRLNVGDRILAVNSINIIHMNHIEIVKLIKESGSSITLTIGHPINSTPQQHVEQDQYFLGHDSNGMGATTNGRLSARQFISPSQQQPMQTPPTTKAIINQNEYHVIELRRQVQGGFGFSIRGGKEFNIPLFVLKLADMGPAQLDGRLQVGDQILEINGGDAYQMTHAEAIHHIKNSGHCVTLLIRRTGMPPPSITDIIAANASAAVNSAQQQQSTSSLMQPSHSSNNICNSDLLLQQQQQQQMLRSKSPFLHQQQPVGGPQYIDSNNIHVQQFKNFNSSGSLVNRNH